MNDVARAHAAARAPEQVAGVIRALLVYPRFGGSSFWNYRATYDAVGARYSATPLGLITVAALLPPSWEVRLVDRNVSELRDADLAWADVVMTGGMLPQQRDTLHVLARAHGMGKPVVVGGPDVTATPQVYAGAEFLVRGEAEEILAGFVSDFERGVPRGAYASERFPDVTRSPVPRFDLLSLRHYMHVGVQFSRGCPYDCEFCNVVELNGHRPRTKDVDQILAELDALHSLGYRGHVDFVDDNLIGNRKAAKGLLVALARWLDRRRHPFEFSTEASINLADDDELLRLLRGANFFAIFVGLETPDPAALVEAHKLQNTRRDLADAVRKIHRAGIFVNAGFIVGFDAERSSVAAAMIACIEASAVPVCMVGLLYALPGTRLERRLRDENRVHRDAHAIGEDDADQCTSGLNFDTRRPRDEMLSDYRAVLEAIYAPGAYFGRVRRVCRELDRAEHRLEVPLRQVARDLRTFGRIAYRVGWLDREARLPFWGALVDCALHNPRAFKIAASFAALYLHFGPYARSLCERIAERGGAGRFEAPRQEIQERGGSFAPTPVHAERPPTRTGATMSSAREKAMNDGFRDVKVRIRKLDELLERGGLTDVEFAQAVSRVRRAAKRGDRSREPSVELRALLERAEGLAPALP